MPVIATEPKRLSDLVKDEYKPTTGYCRKQVVVNEAAAETYVMGTVLGKITATGKYIRAIETAIDGSEVAAAIFIGVPAGDFGIDGDIPITTDTNVTTLIQGPLIVGLDALVLDATYDNATKIDQAVSELEALGIVVQDQL